MRFLWLAALVVVSGLARAQTGEPGDPAHAAGPRETLSPEAQERLDRGRRLFETQQYEAAIEEFKAGYLVQPDPHFLYSIAQAERLRGDCRRALEAYRTFLRTGPPPAEEEVARYNVSRCEEALAKEDARRRQVTAAKAPLAQPPVAGERRAWYADPIGGVLTGLGVAALATGAYFLVSAEDHVEDANRAATEGTWADERDRVRRARVIGVIGLAAGGVLTATGILRYAVMVRSAPRDVAAAPGSGWLVVLEGSF